MDINIVFNQSRDALIVILRVFNVGKKMIWILHNGASIYVKFIFFRLINASVKSQQIMIIDEFPSVIIELVYERIFKIQSKAERLKAILNLIFALSISLELLDIFEREYFFISHVKIY